MSNPVSKVVDAADKFTKPINRASGGYVPTLKMVGKSFLLVVIVYNASAFAKRRMAAAQSPALKKAATYLPG